MNAEEAARIIGCNSRTVLRHIAKGTITATYRHAQELEITQEQVEILRRVLAPFDKSGQSDDMSRQMEELTLRVKVLEEKVRTLESGHVTTEPQPQQSLSSNQNDTEDVPTQKRPQNRIVEPDYYEERGFVSCRVFFEEKGHLSRKIGESTWRRYLKDGIDGEKLEYRTMPRVGNSSVFYFTQEQTEKAVEMLRKHGKIE